MHTKGFKFAAALAAGLLVAAVSACSFSASSRSSSRSSSSPSRSSSRRGDPGEQPGAAPAKVRAIEKAHAAFQEELAAIAVLYVGTGGSAADFQRDITDAAKRNGIPYWELDERVFAAIGVGLQRAGVRQENIAALPFLQGVRNAPLFPAIGDAYREGR